MSKKVEGRIGCWTYKFLSREGRLVLLKAVLQSIPVYWVTIAYIPKGILQKLRKKCFSFLWMAKRHSEGIPLAKWQLLASPKELGGWGIKNPFLFCQSLAVKTLWRLIKNPGSLWGNSYHLNTSQMGPYMNGFEKKIKPTKMDP